MKLFHKAKDGGKDSCVDGYWLIEWKPLFSIVLLRFSKGTREAFHTHAFHALSWIISGHMQEELLDGTLIDMRPSLKPLFTHKNRFHKVHGIADSTWALSFRGPWQKTWKEYLPDTKMYITLTNGRKIIHANSDNR